jgi:hypothetical protein
MRCTNTVDQLDFDILVYAVDKRAASAIAEPLI